MGLNLNVTVTRTSSAYCVGLLTYQIVLLATTGGTTTTTSTTGRSVGAGSPVLEEPSCHGTRPANELHSAVPSDT
eukprot:3132693-Rhodomonas_salina.1